MIELKENARIELEAIREQVTVLLNDVQEALEDPELDNHLNRGMGIAYFVVRGILDCSIERLSVEISEDRRRVRFDVVSGQAR